MDIKNMMILIIDDEKEICNLLKTVLNKEGFQNVYTAYNGNDGLKLFREIKPNIVVLDIMMPDIEGYEVCKEIRKESNIPILFLSAKTEEMDRILGFALGGDDFISKPFSPKEVYYRIRAQLSRSTPKSMEEGFNIGPFYVDENNYKVSKNGEDLKLNPKELKLFIYFAKNANKILSKDMICDYVWGEDYFGFDNTIMVHIRRLREKVEENPSKPQFIRNVKGLGYKLSIGE